LQLMVATDNISHSFNHYPMFGSSRVSLQAQPRARVY